MCRSRFGLLLVILCLCCLSSSTWAVTYNWSGSKSNLWTDPCNWGGGPPASTDTVAIGTSTVKTGSAQVNNGDNASAYSIYLGNSADSNGTLTVNGGILNNYNTWYIANIVGSKGTMIVKTGGTVNNSKGMSVGYNGTGEWDQQGGTTTFGDGINLGYNASSQGTLNVTGGAMSGISTIVVGRGGTGNFNMSAGTVDANSTMSFCTQPNSTGIMNLSGGTITVGYVSFSTNTTVTQKLTITGSGLLKVYDFDGSVAHTLQTYVNWGDIVSTPGYHIKIVWDGFNRTAVTAAADDPSIAHNPSPAAFAKKTVLNPLLGWTAGSGASSHRVNFSKYSGAVTAGTAVVVASQSGTTYNPGALNYGTTYYWRIDELPSGAPATMWQFSTPDSFTVDDMESYASTAALAAAWVSSDGNGVALDTALTNSGNNAMDFTYNGTRTITRTFGTAQDWTAGNLKSMTLFVNGASSNTGTLSIHLMDAGNHVGPSVSPSDVSAVKGGVWYQWDIPLSSLTTAGFNLSMVSKVIISVTSGSGMVTIDDIKLYAPRCMNSGNVGSGDVNNDCVVDFEDISSLTSSWLNNGLWP